MYSTGSNPKKTRVLRVLRLGPHMYSTGSSKVDKTIESS